MDSILPQNEYGYGASAEVLGLKMSKYGLYNDPFWCWTGQFPLEPSKRRYQTRTEINRSGAKSAHFDPK